MFEVLIYQFLSTRALLLETLLYYCTEEERIGTNNPDNLKDKLLGRCDYTLGFPVCTNHYTLTLEKTSVRKRPSELLILWWFKCTVCRKY